jgi:hypothetical protein
VLLSLAVLGLLGGLLFGTGHTEPERKETPLAFLTVDAAQPVLVVLDDELLQGDDPARHRLLRVGEHRLAIKTPDGLPLVEQTFSVVPGEHRVVTVPAYAAAPRVAPKAQLDKPPEPAPSPKVKPKPPANPKRKRPGRR